jgi:hypothetical protein
VRKSRSLVQRLPEAGARCHVARDAGAAPRVKSALLLSISQSPVQRGATGNGCPAGAGTLRSGRQAVLCIGSRTDAIASSVLHQYLQTCRPLPGTSYRVTALALSPTNHRPRYCTTAARHSMTRTLPPTRIVNSRTVPNNVNFGEPLQDMAPAKLASAPARNQ